MSTDVQSISVSALRQLVEAGEAPVILDVRTPGEFAHMHVPGAVNRAMGSVALKTWLTMPASREQPVYVICQSGGRSLRVAQELLSAGFSSVTNVEGGTQAWRDASFPLEQSNRGASRVMSLERQVRITAGALVFASCALGYFVHAGFFGGAAFVGAGLVFAGLTDFCGMGLLLARMPWNR